MNKRTLKQYLTARDDLETLQRTYYQQNHVETTDGDDPRTASREYISKYIELDETRRALLPEIRSFLKDVAGKDAAAFRALTIYFFENPSLSEACRKTDPLYAAQLLRRVTTLLESLK